jgi:DNA-binding PadR family transcriptional regulator
MRGKPPTHNHDHPNAALTEEFGPSGPRGFGRRSRGPRGHGPREHRPEGSGRHFGAPPFGEGGPGRFRGRTRRGEIRTALLAILDEAPGHGYELIQRIEAKTEGRWKPSPGSVYPTLQLLEDEGLVAPSETEGKRTFALTEAGRAEHQRRASDGNENLWTRGEDGRPIAGLMEAVGGIAMAAKQVAMGANTTQIEAATEVIRTARKKLYAILAED